MLQDHTSRLTQYILGNYGSAQQLTWDFQKMVRLCLMFKKTVNAPLAVKFTIDSATIVQEHI